MRVLRRFFAVASMMLCCAASVVPASGQAGGQALAQALSVRRLSEHVDPARSTVKLQIVDERRFQDNSIAVAPLDSSLRETIARERGRADVLEGSPALSVRVKLAYMGFDRTEGGNWIARGTAGVLIVDETAARRTVFDADVTVDEVVGRRSPTGASHPAGSRLISALSSGIVAKIAEADSTVGSRFRRVTAVGFAPAKSISDASVSLATIEALRAACAKAWGIEVDAVTRIVDLTDVTTRTDTKTHGVVRSYARRDQETILTSDGYVVVIVDAIVAMPSN